MVLLNDEPQNVPAHDGVVHKASWLTEVWNLFRVFCAVNAVCALGYLM
ncbi:MAG: hypothetical protein JWM68_5651, partial [Verrucomicrobiales bacterium]|nr:hypothetical protein [Verrucomicrobiales bacterium]